MAGNLDIFGSLLEKGTEMLTDKLKGGAAEKTKDLLGQEGLFTSLIPEIPKAQSEVREKVGGALGEGLAGKILSSGITKRLGMLALGIG